MDLLYANDKAGAYPKSWYAASTTPLAPYPALTGDVRADVCVIGGGFTGLSAALHLAERGYDVVLLEAHRVGFGASGRNGGQLGSGQRADQHTLERMVGLDDARKLWDLAEDAKNTVKSLIKKHNIDCHLKTGLAHACFTKGEVRDEHADAEHLSTVYGYDQITPLDHDGLQEICPSPKYVGGSLDMGAGHLHPLAFALGLAKAAADAGVRIFEMSHVTKVAQGAKPVVQTEHGRVTASNVVFGCNGYLGGLENKVASRVMPINNFVAATRPLNDEELQTVLRQDYAVCDTKFVVNYFRLSHDNRLLFGGGESYGYRFPRDIDATIRKPMSLIYPHLKDIEFDYTWGGTLAITMKRLPYFARIGSNMISASGYSGHGVGTATQAGKLISDAIAGEAEGFDTMARIPTQAFPGGTMLRSPLLVLAMTWFAMRDRLGV